MSNSITLQLEGLPSQDGHLLLADFLARAQNLLSALIGIDRIEGDSQEETLTYRIIDARHTSPLSLTLEPVWKSGAKRIGSDHIERLHEKFFKTVTAIERRLPVPEEIDESVLVSLRGVVFGAGQVYSYGSIKNGDRAVTLNASFEANVNRLLSPQEAVEQEAFTLPATVQYHGEIQGIVHSLFKEIKRPYLVVRELSTRALVKCYFSISMYEKAVDTLSEMDGVVFVEGCISEDVGAGIARTIEVADFRPAPLFDQSFFESFIGSRPNLTGELSAEDAVAKQRSNA